MSSMASSVTKWHLAERSKQRNQRRNVQYHYSYIRRRVFRALSVAVGGAGLSLP